MWHASARGRSKTDSKRLALAALHGVGDAKLGQWISEGLGNGIIHVQRRLTTLERETFRVPEPYDIRGTDEQRRRIDLVYAENPHLRGRI